MFDGVVHGGLHPAPCGVQVVGRRRRPQRLLLQRRHRVVAAHPRVVMQRRLLRYGLSFHLSGSPEYNDNPSVIRVIHLDAEHARC